MDTPTIPPPKTDVEKEILERLVGIRDQLLLLKRDRANYIRSQDVMLLYDDTVEQVRRLYEVRTPGEPVEENRLDRVLDSCFQLLSLFFMTIGRNSEAPAAYALTSTIKRLLDHLTEARLFSAKDLESMGHTLERLRENVQSANSDANRSEYLLTLLKTRVETCTEMLERLKSQLARLDDKMSAIHEKLISILRSTALANTRSKFSLPEVQKFQAQLKEIDSQRVDGKFLAEDGKVAMGSDEVSNLLTRVLKWSDIVLERKGEIPEGFKPIYDTLVDIRNKLDNLSLTQAWSLRETDLYDYQRQLDRIDEARVDGNWLDESGQPAELYVQRTFLYLIRRSYGYIYYLMISSEPVSEALLPVYNQLQTVKRCLLEVKKSGGVSSVRELYPYSMKLNSIDNMRVDGKFMFGGDIPEGQGSVNELLAECFELCYDLRVEADAEADD